MNLFNPFISQDYELKPLEVTAMIKLIIMALSPLFVTIHGLDSFNQNEGNEYSMFHLLIKRFIANLCFVA